jgi:hypothetical protein
VFPACLLCACDLSICLPACLTLLARDLRQDELEKLVEKVNDKRRPGTRIKYSGNQKVWMVRSGVLSSSLLHDV